MTVDELPAYFAAEAKRYAAYERLVWLRATQKARDYARNRSAQIRRREGKVA